MCKKVVILLLIVFGLLFSFNTVLGATEEDVLAAINKTYTVGGEPYRLPDAIISKAKNYLKKHELSSKQCDTILNSINNVVSIAQKAGTTDLTKINKEDIREGLNSVAQASKAANVDLNKHLSKDMINGANDTSKNSSSNSSSNSSNKSLNNNSEKNGSTSNEVETNSGENEEVKTEVSNSPKNEEVNEENNIVNFLLESEEIDKKIDDYMTKGRIIVICVIFITLFLVYLLIKSKWNKIIKVFLIVIFSIVFIISLTILILSFACFNYFYIYFYYLLAF